MTEVGGTRALLLDTFDRRAGLVDGYVDVVHVVLGG